MKTIGLLGGMSWESTVSYYQAINEGVKRQLGGLHSAKVVLNSVDFAQIEKLQHEGDWPATAEILSKAAKDVEKAGADCLLICTNTMHLVADEVAKGISIPLIHIADATGEQVSSKGISKVALLGTAFTMEKDFYKGRLKNNFGLEVLTPGEEARTRVHDVIYQELCLGKISASSKRFYLNVIDDLKQQGAEAVILGCTEIGLLVKQEDSSLPIFDTAEIHALTAVEFALA